MFTHLYTMEEGKSGVQDFLENSMNLLHIFVHRFVYIIM